MAVHDMRYRPYRGPLTAPAARFLVLPRYGLREIFKPRLFTAQFTTSFVFPLACAAFIYVRHNLALSKAVPFAWPAVMNVDAAFFAMFLWVQTILAFIVTLVVMPSLVTPDLVNGALPLYLSHPLSRRGYLAGKLAALVALLSVITWLPGAALYLLEASLAERGWGASHLRLLFGVVAGSWVAIAAMSLPAIAVSVHLKSRARARAALVILVFSAAATGSMLDNALGTRHGSALVAGEVLDAIYQRALGSAVVPAVPLPVALAVVGSVCLVSLGVIVRRLSPVEVVR